jgi:hypothetical protein
MAGDLRSAIADWLQIISAPLTFAGAYGAFHVQSSNERLTENQVTALLILATIAVWVFLFSSYWRLTMRFAPHVESKPLTGIAVFLVSGIVGWLLLCAFELYITEAMLHNPGPLVQLPWIAIPSLFWFFMSFILYMAFGTES